MWVCVGFSIWVVMFMIVSEIFVKIVGLVEVIGFCKINEGMMGCWVGDVILIEVVC